MYLINSLPKLSNLFSCALQGYNLEGEFLECRDGGRGLQRKYEIKFNYPSKWNRRWSWEKRLTCYLQGGPHSGSWAPPAYHCSVQQLTSHLSSSVLFASRIILHTFSLEIHQPIKIENNFDLKAQLSVKMQKPWVLAPKTVYVDANQVDIHFLSKFCK